ncbi:Sec-independent protein translocase protein TatB [Labrys neptuniae]|uniref:Sec-independent protein translocase protein TatB n=1 Tax=Labrys TaxID=204476 RepID=UPI00288DAEDE|nr:Sec-independent protein translocase protein TatB [Labrys neptuniae]MDT3378036.1 Sec-independent protein translocase protein TatB [Labrys neptuniae]
MFDISWSHILIVGAVAVVVIGPKELPSTMRSLGRGVNKLRRMAGEFQGQFNEALKEANLEDVKKEFDTLRQSAATLSSISSPAGLARNALKSSVFDSEPPLSPAAIAPILENGAVAATPSEPSIAGPNPSSLAAKLVGVEIPSAFAPLAAFKS